ncbi:MAG: hypothetical protein AAF628_37795, partial [Planctomycetota bacterium]
SSAGATGSAGVCEAPFDALTETFGGADFGCRPYPHVNEPVPVYVRVRGTQARSAILPPCPPTPTERPQASKFVYFDPQKLHEVFQQPVKRALHVVSGDGEVEVAVTVEVVGRDPVRSARDEEDERRRRTRSIRAAAKAVSRSSTALVWRTTRTSTHH